MKQGNLRNCTKLRNSLLRNGELASLAYGSLKELHKIEELLLREACFAYIGHCFALVLGARLEYIGR
jgi:hypothetical protein